MSIYLCTGLEAVGGDALTAAMPQLPVYRQRRAARYLRLQDRVLSAAAYLLLRYALADTCALTALPDFSYGPYGKPYFAEYPEIRFSFSHTADAVLCAVHACGETGADIQCPEPLSVEICGMFLSEPEQSVVRSSPDPSSDLIRLWTVKEAYCKYTGRGLHSALRDTDFSAVFRHRQFTWNGIPFQCGTVQEKTWCCCGLRNARVHAVPAHTLFHFEEENQ